MQQSSLREKKIMCATAVLFYLCLFTFWLTAKVYAGYIMQTEQSVHAYIAAFHTGSSRTWKEMYELNPSMSGTEEQKIAINVENNSEVAVRYIFSFETEGNLPLVITGNGPEQSVLQKGKEENTWIIERKAGLHQDETYVFTLSLNCDGETYQYAGGVDSIRLTIVGEQID